MLRLELGVLDLTAATLRMGSAIDFRVYAMTEPGCLERATLGEPIGAPVSANTPRTPFQR